VYPSTEQLRYLKSIALGLIVIVTPLVLVVALLNYGFSSWHLKQILNTVEKTEAILVDYNERVIFTSTGKPNCFRSGRIVGRVYCGTEIDLWVKNVVVPAALSAKEKSEVEDFFFSSTQPFPFGGEFNQTIAVYARHLKAWGKYLEELSVCQTIDCYDKNTQKENDITISFKIAEREFYSVIPKPDLVGSKKRIEKIFKDETLWGNGEVPGFLT